MRSLPLFRFGRRASFSSWGMALCTMFIVASFSVAAGLSNSMDALEKNFEADRYLITKPGPSGPQFFSGSEVEASVTSPAFGVVTPATVAPSGLEVTAFAMEGDSSLLPGIPELLGDDMLVGPDQNLSGPVSLDGVGTVSANVTGTFQSPLFPSNWLLGSMALLQELSGSDGMFNFAIVGDVASDAASSLRGKGFAVEPMVGIIDFLSSSVNEIEADVTWVLLPSAFVIAILAYSYTGMETADKRHEIGVLKAIGAGRWRVLGYLMSSALIICAWGGLLGLALGVALSYGVSTFASSMFSSVFVVKAGEILLLEAYVVTVVAGMAGSVLPAMKMTTSSPVDDLKEVAPFS